MLMSSVENSPLGRGLLTGTIKKASDIPEGDYRRNFDRFQAGEALDTNLKLVEKVEALAAKKGVTTTQIAIAWLLEQGVIPIPGSSRPEGVVEALGSAHIQLTEAELRDIRHIIDTADVRGGRYAGTPARALFAATSLTSHLLQPLSKLRLKDRCDQGNLIASL